MKSSPFFFKAVMGAAAIVMLSTGYAAAQSSSDVDNRLRRLENEIQTLGRAVFRGDVQQPPSSFRVEGAASQDQKMVANLGVRITELENQIRQLTGQIEEQSFKIRQLEGQLQAVQTAANRQMPQNMAQPQNTQNMQAMQQSRQVYGSVGPQGVQQQGASQNMQGGAVYNGQNTGEPHQLGQMVQSPNGNGAVNTQNPTYMYDTAFALLQQGDYAAAENALAQFLALYPQHALAANAQYWLGETYYVRNNFEGAAKAFATGYQKYPQSTKAPDSLLKLALSLSNLNKNDEACVTLTQLKNQYPKATSSIMNKADEEYGRLSCAAQ